VQLILFNLNNVYVSKAFGFSRMSFFQMGATNRFVNNTLCTSNGYNLIAPDMISNELAVHEDVFKGGQNIEELA